MSTAESTVTTGLPVREGLEIRVRADRSSRRVALLSLSTAIVWLPIGSAIGALASLKMHFPDWLADPAWLTFGRIRPVHLNAMIYGWASLAMIGVSFWMIPRLVHTELRWTRLAGYSVALGAFIAGAVLHESGAVRQIEVLLQPVRDMFAAIFFVAVGMLIDPLVLMQIWPLVLMLVGVVLVGKTVGVTTGAMLAGYSLRTAMHAGLTMTQIGEFSFIIAGLTLTAATTETMGNLFPVAVAVSVVTSLALGVVSSTLAERFGLPPMLARAAVLLIGGLLALPFGIGLVTSVRRLARLLSEGAMPPVAKGKVDQAAAPRRTLALAIEIGVVVLVGIPVVIVSQPFVPYGGAAVVAALLLLLGIAFWRNATDLRGHALAGAELVVCVLGRQGTPGLRMT